MQVDDNETSLQELNGQQEKDQVESRCLATSGANPSEIEGCLNVISSAPSTSSFDDNIEIDFARPLLESPILPNLKFLDQSTPQSQIQILDVASASANPSKQGQPPAPKA